MTTVSQLIEYLQTLPGHTTVVVAVNVDGNYQSYTARESLELPDEISPDCSDNLDFMGSEPPVLLLGRT